MCALTNREKGNHSDLGELFDRSHFNTEELRGQFRRYRGICDSPPMRQELTIIAAQAKDLAGFLRELPGHLPNARDGEILQDVFTRFEPVYDDLVWRPSVERIGRFQAKLAKLSRQTDFASLQAHAAAFYGASNDARLLIVLIPVPGGHGGAQPLFGDLFPLEIPIDERTLTNEQVASSYGVIFHEMCHKFYDRKAAALARRIGEIMGNQPGDDRPFNEALAINAGIWAERKVGGRDKDRQTDCSYDHRTCAVAKTLQPMIEDYLEASKPIDEAFLSSLQESVALLPRQ